jgi:methylated-DNA-[protein]-cysteine S-methyltransferase
MTTIASLPTQTGTLWLSVADGALDGVSFSRMPGIEATDPLLSEACAQLQAWLDGRTRSFDLPLADVGTTFRKEVWAALRAIPYGETTTYADLARALGRPDAARAVGAAIGANPWLVVVPCHRVVGADGSLTGYAGGMPRKRWLLGFEARRSLPLFREPEA